MHMHLSNKAIHNIVHKKTNMKKHIQDHHHPALHEVLTTVTVHVFGLGKQGPTIHFTPTHAYSTSLDLLQLSGDPTAMTHAAMIIFPREANMVSRTGQSPVL